MIVFRYVFCKISYKPKFHSLINDSLLRYKNNQKRFGVYDVYLTIVGSNGPVVITYDMYGPDTLSLNKSITKIME